MISVHLSEPDQAGANIPQDALQVGHAIRLMAQICAMIRDGTLQVGDRLPAERELARQVRITQVGVGTGIGYLAMIGVLNLRQGRGAFVAMSAAELADSELAQNHIAGGQGLNCIFEARMVLAGNLAALAAERCNGKHSVKLAEELTELYASADHPEEYLIHEMAFHRVVAQAAGNPILCALMTRINAAIYDTCRHRESPAEDLYNSADRHRKVFRAIRNHKPDEARKAMQECLWVQSSRNNQTEPFH